MHIFRFPKNNQNELSMWRMIPYLSTICDPVRDFAYLKTPEGKSNISSIDSNLSQIRVITTTGEFLTYGFDAENGGGMQTD